MLLFIKFSRFNVVGTPVALKVVSGYFSSFGFIILWCCRCRGDRLCLLMLLLPCLVLWPSQRRTLRVVWRRG